MDRSTFGELLPRGGGDSIPLLRKNLKIGRRESCDIVLRFANVSAHHCQLTINGGYWYVRDLESRNGIKVNGIRVQEKIVHPGDQISIAKHVYEIRYAPSDLGAKGPPPPDEPVSDLFDQSLLQRAGLSGGRSTPKTSSRRFDVTRDEPGKLRQKRNDD
ncbi:MAG: FHA domain-containing protein [Pirellulales bacterium]